MIKASRVSGSDERPFLVTAGFTTVDAREVGGASVELCAGGTALNVARAVSTLGLSSALAGTIGDDPAGRLIDTVLAGSGVDVSSLARDSGWNTPVLLQVPRRGDHAWRFSCPDCGARLPKYRPAPAANVASVLERYPAPRVFLFDRPSRFALELARTWRDRGSFVVFEPASLARPNLFMEAASVSHLVKFSSGRAEEFRSQLNPVIGMQIETMGAQGARWRLPRQDAWIRQAAVKSPVITDSAGAGDWTTAGLLVTLLSSTELFDNAFDPDAVASALSRGQELGAEACTWRGPFPHVDHEIRRADFEAFACPRWLADQP